MYETDNGGNSWSPRGPMNLPAGEHITRVLFQPPPYQFTWLAGTSQGRLWMQWFGVWIPQFTHLNKAPILSMASAPTDPRVLYVLFDWATSPEHRIYRFVQQPAPSILWQGEPIAHKLPVNTIPTVVCGDGFNSSVVYVGTAAGVYRGHRLGVAPFAWSWEAYNVGLPLVEISDLLVDPVSKQLRAGTMGRGAWAVLTGP